MTGFAFEKSVIFEKMRRFKENIHEYKDFCVKENVYIYIGLICKLLDVQPGAILCNFLRQASSAKDARTPCRLFYFITFIYPLAPFY